jgi:hypothetical protein
VRGGSASSIALGGLLLQGAVFDGIGLTEPSADAQELVSVPPCRLAYSRKSSDESKMADDLSITIPLYYSTDRERMLVEVLQLRFPYDLTMLCDPMAPAPSFIHTFPIFIMFVFYL